MALQRCMLFVSDEVERLRQEQAELRQRLETEGLSPMTRDHLRRRLKKIPRLIYQVRGQPATPRS